MFHFEPRPIKWVLLVFGVEVFIALYARDALIRPYGGDVLAVILVYAALRVVLRIEAWVLALVSFAVGALVEVAQLVHLSSISRTPGKGVAIVASDRRGHS